MKEDIEIIKALIKRYDTMEETRNKLVNKITELENKEDEVVNTMSELEVAISALIIIEFPDFIPDPVSCDIEKIKNLLKESKKEK